MNVKFTITNIDGAELEFYFVNCFKIGETICIHQKYHIGKIVKLLPNMFLEVHTLIKKKYFYFKGFCLIILHKLILKQVFLGLGWAQVHRSQLGLMP